MPSVVGMNYKVAEKKLREKGFTCRFVWQENQSEPNQDVILQSIQAGEKKIKKTCITLYVSKKVEQKKKTNEYDGVITY